MVAYSKENKVTRHNCTSRVHVMINRNSLETKSFNVSTAFKYAVNDVATSL